LKEIDMLAYAANVRRRAARPPSPQAMLLIVAAHVALIALVMSAKMDLPARIIPHGITIDLIKVPKPPPERPRETPRNPAQSAEQHSVIIPMPQPTRDTIDQRPIPLPLPGGDTVGPAPDPQPTVDPLPVRLGPRLATPASELRPPYPPSKISSEEEAVLRLRLAIDARGRVTAVDPVGRADPAFLEAARRHLIAHWRYKPASEDGRALASSTVITLRFQLDD
jgi:protein TonB